MANRLYLPFAQTNFVAEYDTNSGLELSRITTPGIFDWIGNYAFIEGRTKVAADGSYLFTTLDNGVYFHSLVSEPVRDVPEPSSILGFLIAAGFGISFVRKPKAQAAAVANCKHQSSL